MSSPIKFDPTGEILVDVLLDAVERAARGLHNVNDWTDSYFGDKPAIEEIQEAANLVAEAIRELRSGVASSANQRAMRLKYPLSGIILPGEGTG